MCVCVCLCGIDCARVLCVWMCSCLCVNCVVYLWVCVGVCVCGCVRLCLVACVLVCCFLFCYILDVFVCPCVDVLGPWLWVCLFGVMCVWTCAGCVNMCACVVVRSVACVFVMVCAMLC